jgi:deoxyribodipyrimidine photolyase-related protein
MKTLRLILGDQLNIDHSWFTKTDESVVYCMFEMRQETDYVRHHIQKVVGFFAAMREFAAELKSRGHQVVYFKINDETNTQLLTENIKLLIQEYAIHKFEYLLPDEYRLDHELKEICKNLPIESESNDTEHFYTSRTELKDFFKGKKQFLMENFYRYMRKKHDILIVMGQPEGGKWNFDKSNRKKWNRKESIPQQIIFENDISDILKDIRQAGIDTMGLLKVKTFDYPINRKQALKQLSYFCENLLVKFGDYQDAMDTNEVYLFHSRISFALNVKLLSPKEVVNTVLVYYRNHSDNIDISQVEGFVRQILGWREYMRGMYWHTMPEYKTLNHLNNKNQLPDFFWTGKTKMNCLSHSINNSLQNAYAHHIQRLMITGNYALMTQIDPDQVDAWYLGIYIDAVEWVQLPNTRGMSQYADGGLIATKPYISSGAYINKMSNYCNNCHYNNKEKTSENACPFNSLYWNFLDEKRSSLKGNRRMAMMYSLLDKMDKDQLSNIKERANRIIQNPNEY